MGNQTNQHEKYSGIREWGNQIKWGTKIIVKEETNNIMFWYGKAKGKRMKFRTREHALGQTRQ